MRQKKVQKILNNLIFAVNLLEETIGKRVTLDDVLQQKTTLNLPEEAGVKTKQTMSNPYAGHADFSQYTKEILQSVTILENRAESLWQTQFNIQEDLKNKDYANLLWHLGEHRLKGMDVSHVRCEVNLGKLYSIAETVYDVAESYDKMGYSGAGTAKEAISDAMPSVRIKSKYKGELDFGTIANYLAVKQVVPATELKGPSVFSKNLKERMQDYFTEDRIIGMAIPLGIILFFGLIYGAVSYQKKMWDKPFDTHKTQLEQKYTK